MKIYKILERVSLWNLQYEVDCLAKAGFTVERVDLVPAQAGYDSTQPIYAVIAWKVS